MFGKYVHKRPIHGSGPWGFLKRLMLKCPNALRNAELLAGVAQKTQSQDVVEWSFVTRWCTPSENYRLLNPKSWRWMVQMMFQISIGKLWFLDEKKTITHSIHGIFTYIYHYLPYKSTIHVGKYTSPMDAMGYLFQGAMCFFWQAMKLANLPKKSPCFATKGSKT